MRRLPDPDSIVARFWPPPGYSCEGPIGSLELRILIATGG
jgi:hypothetical protein